FSSRRRHTRFSRDWSSDVCSSDLKLRSLCCCQQRLIIDSNETATHPRIPIRAGKIVEHVTRLRVSPPKLLPIGESPTTRPLKLRIPSERPFFTYRLGILNSYHAHPQTPRRTPTARNAHTARSCRN